MAWSWGGMQSAAVSALLKSCIESGSKRSVNLVAPAGKGMARLPLDRIYDRVESAHNEDCGNGDH